MKMVWHPRPLKTMGSWLLVTMQQWTKSTRWTTLGLFQFCIMELLILTRMQFALKNTRQTHSMASVQVHCMLLQLQVLGSRWPFARHLVCAASEHVCSWYAWGSMQPCLSALRERCIPGSFFCSRLCIVWPCRQHGSHSCEIRFWAWSFCSGCTHALAQGHFPFAELQLLQLCGFDKIYPQTWCLATHTTLPKDIRIFYFFY